MATHTKSRGTGRTVDRSGRFEQRMQRATTMVRALCGPWEALSPDLRNLVLRWLNVVGLMLIGLPGWIIQVVR